MLRSTTTPSHQHPLTRPSLRAGMSTRRDNLILSLRPRATLALATSEAVEV